jgi:DNA-3-methyladenine glycosylase II
VMKAPLHTADGALAAHAPFDFTHTLRFMDRFTPAEGDQTLGARGFTKAFMLGDRAVAFRVTGDDGGVHYRLFAASPPDDALAAQAEDRIAFFLSLADDLTPFYAIARDDDAFSPVVESWYGYHQVKFITPFENAAWAILSARNSIPAARTLKARLIEACGATLVVEGAAYSAFPTPAALASAGPIRLREWIGAEQRARYLAAAAEAFARVDEGWLRSGDYDAVKDWLLAITGVGEWTAAFVLIRGLGRTERLEAPEERLIRAASRLYGRALTRRGVQQIAERYGAYKGYWAHYIRAEAETW